MKRTMRQTYAAPPTTEASTRDCIEPWFYMQLRANNNVLPCCWHPPVGTLQAGKTLDDVERDLPMRLLRYQLLAGDLDDWCKTCPVRPLTDTATLRKHLEQALSGDMQPSDETGRE